MRRKILILLTSLLPSMVVVVRPVIVVAEIQIEVSGNGPDTQNTVNVESLQTTTVTQENTANIENDIHQETDSGGNNISDTTGSKATIQTGEVTESTLVVNELNSSQLAANCCNENQINITVSGNGNNSVNTINTQVASNTIISITQIANVNNDINLSGNTGKNTIANVTDSKALIDTGSIKVNGTLTSVLNKAEVKVGKGAWDITIINKDNGDNSINVVYLDFVDNLYISKFHLADINNRIYADLNTGKNKILNTLTDVTINTGEIDFSFNVNNDSINTSRTHVICCENGEVPGGGDGEEGSSLPSPSPGAPPPTGVSGNGEHKNEDGGVGGEVLAAAAGILPITGASALHFWILAVVYLISFLSGLYMRLKAGRSPNSHFLRGRFQGYILLTF